MKCLILAGGFAVRLYPLTVNRPKALLEFKGQPIINHIVRKIPRDIDIMVSTSRKFEADFLQWKGTIERDVEILVEEAMSEEQKLGAVGSLDFWIENLPISEGLLVLAADNYFEFRLSSFMDSYDSQHALVAVHDLGSRDKATQFGVVQLTGNKIVNFEEKPVIPQSSLVATACYILPKRIFPFLHQYCQQSRRDNLGSFIAHLLDVDEVHAYTFLEAWSDIGSLGKSK